MTDISGENPNLYGNNYKQLVLTLGYRCNMNCKSCFIGDKLGDHKTTLTYEDCVAIIESAANLRTIETVSFVGGEPFVYYPIMLKLSTYIFKHYKCPLNVTTNAYWARSTEMAARMLDPLYDRGMRLLMASLDEYHLEFGKIEHTANCLQRCHDLGIKTTVQVINRRNAPTILDFKEALQKHVDIDNVTWYENPCSAIGNASTMLKKEDMEWHEEIPTGGCSAGEILNIQPDGKIKPCCGAGLMSPRLSIGNGKCESVDHAVEQSEADSIVNSLIANQGPRGLAHTLIDHNRADLVKKHAPFTDACHACQSFLNDLEVLDVLEKAMSSIQIEILIQRVLSVHNIKIMQHIHEGKKYA